MRYIEKVAVFGEHRNLIGITSIPEVPHRINRNIAVIILNSGLVHRVGPNRLGVDLARTLSKQGYIALRFDLSGLGDSQIAATGVSESERAVIDIMDAMNFITDSYNTSNFVLIGNCTGADNAHRATVKDSRVTGAVFLDGYRYPTWRYYIRLFLHYMSVIVNPVRLSKAIYRRTIGRVFSAGKHENAGRGEDAFGWNLPPKESVNSDLQALVERKVHLFYIYSRLMLECFNTADFENAFKSIDFKGYLQVKRFHEASHTYRISEHREALIKCISRWIQDRFQ